MSEQGKAASLSPTKLIRWGKALDKGQQKLILAGLAIIGVVILFINMGSSPDLDETVVQTPKFSGSIPIDANKVRQKLNTLSNQTSSHSLIADGEWQSGAGYSALSLNVSGADKLAPILVSLYDQDITSIALIAEISGQSASEPILEYQGSREGGFSVKTSFDGLLSGFSPIQDEDSTTVDVDLVFGLKNGTSQIVPKALSWAITPEAAKSIISLNSKEGSELGHIEVNLVSRPPRLVGKLSGSPLDYDAVLTSELDMGQTLGEALSEKSTALNDFWAAKGDDFNAACASLRQALTLDVGLTAADATTALLAITSRHALFATGISYETACLDGETARALEMLDADFPSGERRYSASSSLTQRLSQVGRLMRDSNPDNSRSKLEALFADSTLIRDPHGLVGTLSGAETFEGNGLSVLPTATPEAGAEYLLSLPIAHFACFSSGSGMGGLHRAGLVEFAGDKTIWVLDLAFDDDSKISGISVAQATKKEICRAIATRTTPDSQCYFSKNGPVAPAQCR